MINDLQINYSFFKEHKSGYNENLPQRWNDIMSKHQKLRQRLEFYAKIYTKNIDVNCVKGCVFDSSLYDAELQCRTHQIVIRNPKKAEGVYEHFQYVKTMCQNSPEIFSY